MSQKTPSGCQKEPTRFLPSGRLTPVLPPMAASTWPSSVVGTLTTASATVVARRRVAGHVGHDPATDGDDDVAAVHVATGHEPADLLDRRERLGPLPVRDRHDLERHARVDLDPDSGLGHHGRAAGARRKATRDLAPYAGAHEHVVATLCELDLHAYRLAAARIVGDDAHPAHGRSTRRPPVVGASSCARAARTTSSASASGRRTPARTTTSDSSRYTGLRRASRRSRVPAGSDREEGPADAGAHPGGEGVGRHVEPYDDAGGPQAASRLGIEHGAACDGDDRRDAGRERRAQRGPLLGSKGRLASGAQRSRERCFRSASRHRRRCLGKAAASGPRRYGRRSTCPSPSSRRAARAHPSPLIDRRTPPP